MIKRFTILGMIIVSILVFSTFSVNAADEELSFEDPTDDVRDYLASIDEEVYTKTKPNLDLIEVEYTKNGKEVTLNLKVKGKIEDKGDLEDEESLELVSYMALLYTSKETYDIIYVNKECLLNDDTKGINWRKIGNSVLSFSFDLESSDEVYYASEIATLEYSEINMYADDFYHESDAPILDAGGPYDGDKGENISFTGEILGGVSPFSYTWDFGDGTSSTLQNPTHAYSETGTYMVTLTVIDNNGTTAIDTAKVVIGGSNNENDDNGGSNLFLFIALIAIVVVIGVVVVIVVIRR